MEIRESRIGRGIGATAHARVGEADMEQVGSQEGTSKKPGKAARPSLGRFVALWAMVMVGLALAGEGGVLFADARTHWAGHGAWIGLVAMAVGALGGLSAMYALYVQARASSPPEELPVDPEPAVPMLGALLVYKYRVITEEQLERALELQRKEQATRRRIGSILLDMGLLSMAELQEALAYQRGLSLPGRARIPKEEAGEAGEAVVTAAASGPDDGNSGEGGSRG